MKVLLIYPNIAKTLQVPMGLAYISSYLKANGIDVFLWDNTFDSIEKLHELIRSGNPDVICFSALSPDYAFTENLARSIRDLTKARFIIGGYHATFATDQVYYSGIFELIIRGEAEYSLLNYINNIKNEPYPLRIIRGALVDVNKIPFPDHEMFKRHFAKQLNWDNGKYETIGVFITSRGCPFKCAYCSCKAFADLYDENVTRLRIIDDVIYEVYKFKQKYNMDAIWFTDETFTINKKRTIEFCKKYKEAIDLPFSIETRPDTVNEEVLVALKDAGCTTVRMGIESGVDRIRNGLYKRNISREKILDSFLTAKRVGLDVASFNICGAPTETIEDIRETISLNVECKVQSGKMTILSVFPGTEMWNYCIEHGYKIRENYPENYYIDSNITHESLSIPQLIELRHEFNLKIK